MFNVWQQCRTDVESTEVDISAISTYVLLSPRHKKLGFMQHDTRLCIVVVAILLFHGENKWNEILDVHADSS